MQTAGRFPTLLHREWMQHHTGWLIVMALPVLLLTLVGSFGTIQFDDGDTMPPPLVLALTVVAGAALASMGLTWAASLLMSPGLARRDVQDRSIEFWLSLPISHLQSLSATLLMHMVLIPWLALGVGLLGGLLGSLLVVTRMFGFSEWLALPWGTLAAAALAGGLRTMLGLVLATLWLSPLILLTMAASAWLKRWGVPLVAGLILVGGNVLDRLYGITLVWDVLQTLGRQASQAFMVSDRISVGNGPTIRSPDEIPAMLALLPAWALEDGLHALAALASPAFAGAMLGAAAGFGLLWLRRQRGA